MNFTVSKENKTINVEREFAAPLSQVWPAWTQSEILDKWWAPKPWKAETKSQEFREGGKWLYAMVGPEGEKHWSCVEYKSIFPMQSFSGTDAFCDENGNINTSMPRTTWTNTFAEAGNKTKVSIELKFNDVADMDVLLQMGFKEGFTMGMDNLDELLAQ